MENDKTEETLVIKRMKSAGIVLASRYPSNSGKQWIEANEKKAVERDFYEQNRQIFIDFPINNM
jgi:pyridoxine/pyridoxamine 5'-phosphate oxidase